MAMRRPPPSAELIYHSDRGRQYGCRDYQRILGAHGIRCNMSRNGSCLDNTVVQRVLGSLNRERTAQPHCAPRDDARIAPIANS